MTIYIAADHLFLGSREVMCNCAFFYTIHSQIPKTKKECESILDKKKF